MLLVHLHFTFCPSSHSSSPPSSCQLEYFDWEQYTKTIILGDIWYSGPRRLEMDFVKNVWPSETTWKVRWGKIRKPALADSFLLCWDQNQRKQWSSFYITADFWVYFQSMGSLLLSMSIWQMYLFHTVYFALGHETFNAKASILQSKILPQSWNDFQKVWKTLRLYDKIICVGWFLLAAGP